MIFTSTKPCGIREFQSLRKDPCLRSSVRTYNLQGIKRKGSATLRSRQRLSTPILSVPCTEDVEPLSDVALNFVRKGLSKDGELVEAMQMEFISLL